MFLVAHADVKQTRLLAPWCSKLVISSINMLVVPVSFAGLAGFCQCEHILWMDEILHHLRNPGMIDFLVDAKQKMGFDHGFKAVAKWILCPSTACQGFCTQLTDGERAWPWADSWTPSNCKPVLFSMFACDRIGSLLSHPPSRVSSKKASGGSSETTQWQRMQVGCQ